MHTYTKDGVTFHFNSDLSGEVAIDGIYAVSDHASIPYEALRDFVFEMEARRTELARRIFGMKTSDELFGPKLMHKDYMGVHLCAAMPDQLPDAETLHNIEKIYPRYQATIDVTKMKRCDACDAVYRRIMRSTPPEAAPPLTG